MRSGLAAGVTGKAAAAGLIPAGAEAAAVVTAAAPELVAVGEAEGAGENPEPWRDGTGLEGAVLVWTGLVTGAVTNRESTGLDRSTPASIRVEEMEGAAGSVLTPIGPAGADGVVGTAGAAAAAGLKGKTVWVGDAAGELAAAGPDRG